MNRLEEKVIRCPVCSKTAYVDETALIATIPQKCYIHCEECNNNTLIKYDDILLYKESENNDNNK